MMSHLISKSCFDELRQIIGVKKLAMSVLKRFPA